VQPLDPHRQPEPGTQAGDPQDAHRPQGLARRSKLRLVPPDRVVLSRHALHRWAERVQPGCSPFAACAGIREFLKGATERSSSSRMPFRHMVNPELAPGGRGRA
jgi:hypothetical protein